MDDAGRNRADGELDLAGNDGGRGRNWGKFSPIGLSRGIAKRMSTRRDHPPPRLLISVCVFAMLQD